jgi:hypothetical protein
MEIRHAAKVIIQPSNQHRRYLFVESQKSRSLNLAGGGIDRGEAEDQAANRELREELGEENAERVSPLRFLFKIRSRVTPLGGETMIADWTVFGAIIEVPPNGLSSINNDEPKNSEPSESTQLAIPTQEEVAALASGAKDFHMLTYSQSQHESFYKLGQERPYTVLNLASMAMQNAHINFHLQSLHTLAA